ncbi:hypothetical protein EVAR_49410_1 [Eumeta japonica]|uniref:Uncharacterized protein n=1 Tax=Eumeta variegata TaxID=151549 RepID=A0A4C1Y8A3_EUMVA|nr:hypothetical protein EVAR_49410_1 [Eumeta japonica]
MRHVVVNLASERKWLDSTAPSPLCQPTSWRKHPILFYPIFTQETGSALVIPPEPRVSMGGGNHHLYSRGSHARLSLNNAIKFIIFYNKLEQDCRYRQARRGAESRAEFAIEIEDGTGAEIERVTEIKNMSVTRIDRSKSIIVARPELKAGMR